MLPTLHIYCFRALNPFELLLPFPLVVCSLEMDCGISWPCILWVYVLRSSWTSLTALPAVPQKVCSSFPFSVIKKGGPIMQFQPTNVFRQHMNWNPQNMIQIRQEFTLLTAGFWGNGNLKWYVGKYWKRLDPGATQVSAHGPRRFRHWFRRCRSSWSFWPQCKERMGRT